MHLRFLYESQSLCESRTDSIGVTGAKLITGSSLYGRQQPPQVLRLMKTVTESATREAAKAALAVAIAELEKKAPKVARLLEESGEEILGVYALPEAHRRRMHTTNMLERQNQELKRRTRVIRGFPHEQSYLRLVAALLMETNLDWMGEST
jgi:transposase-like protein